MKSLVFLSLAMFALPYSIRAQTSQLLFFTFSATASGAQINPFNPYLSAQIDSLNVRINGVGTANSWTAQIQTSPDNVTWTNCGSSVTATADSSNSGGACTPVGALYVRVNITAGSGGGTLNGTLMGTCSLCQLTTLINGVRGPYTFTGAVTQTGSTFNFTGGSGTFVTLSGDAISTATGGATTVVGIEGHAIAAPSTAAFVHWSGSAWEYTNPSGSGTVTTSGSPVSPNVACFSSSTAITSCTSANVQTAIGSGVYQAPLSLLAGTYINGDMCTYASSGTLLNCNTAVPSGTGTVTHTAGALTALQVMIGNGAADSNVDTGCSTDGAGNLTCASYSVNVTTPSALSLPAGTGNIPTLPTNSAGFAAPVTGGTAYVFKMPATITAGILHAATPATGDGVNESAMTSSLVAIADLAATGTPGSTTYLRGDNTWATPSGSSGLSGMTTGQIPIAASATTVTSSIAYATAATASTIVERDSSNNINATTFTGALSGNATTATSATSATSATTASNLSGTPAVPNGTTATTQTTGDNTTKLATDAFVIANAGGSGGAVPIAITISGSTLAANTCASVLTATLTGAVQSTTGGAGSLLSWGYSSDPTGITGWGNSNGMGFFPWISAANTVSYKVCNVTGTSITYGGIILTVGAR